MNKSASEISDLAPVAGGIDYGAFDYIHNPSKIIGLVEKDHGLSSKKKKSLTTMLNSPEAFDHIVSGVAGMAVGRAIAHYASLSKPARTLLSLAGFGIGNIIYNTLQDEKFSSYDKKTGISTINKH
jgi:hypothetical protein